MAKNRRKARSERRAASAHRRRARGSGGRPAAPWWRGWQGAAIALAVAGGIGLFIAGLMQGGGGPPGAGISDAPVTRGQLEAGAGLYADACAACHGVEGEGFAAPGIPAPPLDGSAHSWHHADEQIVGLIRRGGTQMPAVGATWSDEQIRAVMAYVKQRWEPWQREAQPGDIGEVIE